MSAIGFRDHHQGWAAAVTITGGLDDLRVLDRRRLTLCHAGLPARVYHAARGMGEARALAVIEDVRSHATATAEEQVRELMEVLRAANHPVRAAAIPLGTQSAPAELDQILASHTLLHVAEAELYREALCDAAQRAALAVVRFDEKHGFADAARKLSTTVPILQAGLDALRPVVGSPWTKLEKEAAAASLLAQATH